ncbi:MAG: tetratricopeptide repeat protein [Bacteroides ovatus]
MSYYSIGSLYIIQGDKSKALNYYEKSLKIRLSVYGENHPLTKEIMDLINVAANSKVLQSPETTK